MEGRLLSSQRAGDQSSNNDCRARDFLKGENQSRRQQKISLAKNKSLYHQIFIKILEQSHKAFIAYAPVQVTLQKKETGCFPLIQLSPDSTYMADAQYTGFQNGIVSRQYQNTSFLLYQYIWSQSSSFRLFGPSLLGLLSGSLKISRIKIAIKQKQMEEGIGIKLKNYRILEILNEGAYGEVFKAQNLTNNKLYAVKVLLRSFMVKQNKEHEAYLEGQVLRALNHPGIIHVEELIVDDQNYYIVMELCDGGDLFNHIQHINRDIAKSVNRHSLGSRYLTQVALALAYLHSMGVVHRDIKPENVVINHQGNCKLVDFGTCQLEKPALLMSEEAFQKYKNLKAGRKESTRKGSLAGSANYISPEGIQGTYSRKGDVWSFGVLFFYFYHGKLPFTGDNNYDIFHAIMKQEPTISSNQPESARKVMQACLQKDASLRPTMEDLLEFDYFRQVDLKAAFEPRQSSSPKKELSEERIIFQSDMEKKMFFGNFKPRTLVLSTKGTKLCVAYKYVETQVVKREVELHPSDYAQEVNKEEFFIQVKADDEKYFFRTHQVTAEEWCRQINSSIREHFGLS